jgi:hypothetical protein
MENYLPISIVVVGITIMLISVGIFLFNYNPKRKIKTYEETTWQISTDPDFNKKLYSSSLNAIRVLEAKKDIRELVAKKIKMNNGFKIGDTVVVVISDEKYKGKIVKVKKDNRCRVYISALETTLTFKSSDITLKQRK